MMKTSLAIRNLMDCINKGRNRLRGKSVNK